MLLTPPPSPKLGETVKPEERLGQTLAGRYHLTGILGTGAYGTVYKALDVESNVEYAVKALNKCGLDPRERQFQEREIRLHYRASEHPNVVSMAKILDSPECTFVVLEYCSEGDLFAKITEEHHYVGDDEKAKCAFLQILDAVRHCHSLGIYHRDLKPENILVKDDGWTLKLADFGLATEERITSDFGCGSTFYMSPECQQSNPKAFSCYASAPNDVWALGVILVNLTCGRNPWKRAALEDSTFKAFAQDRNYLQTILPISGELNYILQRIFEIDPRRRISLAELRDLIVRASRLSESPPVPSQPLKPEPSTVGRMTNQTISELDITSMGQLPAQPYALGHPHYPFPQSTTIVHGIPTPPGSNVGSPLLLPYTFAVKPPVPAVCFPYASQPGFAPNVPTWQRCGQLLSNLPIPRSSCFWTNIPAY